MRNVSPALAFDYAASNRSIDADGRLHVAGVNLTKAAVNGYLGSEIPDGERLGLDANRIYMMYRDPAEIAKAARTFNNLPVLSRHVPVSAADHRPDLVVGSTGSNANFGSPYLRNDIVVWAADSIAGINSRKQRELSAAYRYIAIMTPGVADGVRFDGRMVDLVGNHIAIVPEGRVGPDVALDAAVRRAVFQKITLTDFPHWNRLKA